MRAALSDWRGFSSDKGIGLNPIINQAWDEALICQDPPVHTDRRKIMNEALGPVALKPLQDTIDRRADALAERLLAMGRFDAVTEGTAYGVVAACLTPPVPDWPVAVAVRREADELMVAIVGADPRHVEDLEVQVAPLGGSVSCVQKRQPEGATITVRFPCG